MDSGFYTSFINRTLDGYVFGNNDDPLNLGTLSHLRCLTLIIEQEGDEGVDFTPWGVHLLSKVPASNYIEEIRIACTLVDDVTCDAIYGHRWDALDALLTSPQFSALRRVSLSYYLLGEVSYTPEFVTLALRSNLVNLELNGILSITESQSRSNRLWSTLILPIRVADPMTSQNAGRCKRRISYDFLHGHLLLELV